jgi:hypothetical protein
MPRGMDWERVAELVENGIKWINKKQPKGAILQHHGIHTNVPGLDISLGTGHSPVNSGGVVLVFDIGHRHIFSNKACKRLEKLVKDVGGEVVDRWNGVGCGSFSIAISNEYRGLKTAVNNYGKMCPKHKTVFCGWQGTTKDEKACNWFSEGYRKVKKPEGWS